MSNDNRPKFQAQEGPQKEFLSTPAKVAIYGGSAGGGKSLPMWENVLTPSGWAKNGDLKEGDLVIGRDGLPSKVLKIYDQDNLKFVNIKFCDGTEVTCCEDHLWNVSPTKDLAISAVVSTKIIKQQIDKSNSFYIPCCDPVNYKSATPVDINKSVDYILSMNTIPAAVMHGTVEDRLSVIRLICEKRLRLYPTSVGYRGVISTANGMLANELTELLRSVGLYVKQSYRDRRKSGKGVEFRLYIRFHFNPFPVYRKEHGILKCNLYNVQSKKIKSITYLNMVDEGRCIAIDNKDSLYITSGFNVTHNTYALLLDQLRHIGIDGYSGAIFRRTIKDIKNPGSIWDESKTIYTHFKGEPVEYNSPYWKFNHNKKGSLGSRIRFLGLEYEKELENYKGAQIPVIGFDELSTFTERMFWYMLSRNRAGSVPIRPYMRATTNPLPNSWLSRLIDWWIGEDGLIIPERSGKIRYLTRYKDELIWGDTMEECKELAISKGEKNPLPFSFTFIRSSIMDNKKLLENDPEYLAGLQGQNEADRAMLLDGNWKFRKSLGVYFKEDWCEKTRFIDEPMQVVLGVDVATTKPNKENKNPDYTALVALGKGKTSGRYYVLGVRRFRENVAEVKKRILKYANELKSSYGNVRVVIEQDAGGAGKISARDIAKSVIGHDVRIRTTGNKGKVDRFLPFSSACENGEVTLLEGEYITDWATELEGFLGNGQGKDDQADGTSTAYNELNAGASRLGSISMSNLKTVNHFRNKSK